MIVLNRKAKPTDRVLFSPDGQTLAVAGGDRKPLELWHVHEPEAPQLILPVRLAKASLHFAFSPDGGELLVADGDQIIAFDTDNGNRRWLIQPEKDRVIGGLDVMADGHIILGKLYASNTSTPYECWARKGGGEPARKWSVKREPYTEKWMCGRVICPPRSERVAFVEYISFFYSARIILHPTERGRRVDELNCGEQELKGVAAPADGRFLGVITARAINVWETRSLKASPQTISNPSRFAFTSLAFHPSGRFLAVTSNDATVKLYDTSNWSLATTYTWDVGRMRSVAFSPDGLLAAAGSDTGRVVVWDVDV